MINVDYYISSPVDERFINSFNDGIKKTKIVLVACKVFSKPALGLRPLAIVAVFVGIITLPALIGSIGWIVAAVAIPILLGLIALAVGSHVLRHKLRPLSTRIRGHHLQMDAMLVKVQQIKLHLLNPQVERRPWHQLHSSDIRFMKRVGMISKQNCSELLRIQSTLWSTGGPYRGIRATRNLRRVWEYQQHRWEAVRMTIYNDLPSDEVIREFRR